MSSDERAPPPALARGLALLRAGDARAALVPLAEALATDPASARVWLATGLALTAVGDHAGAVEALRRTAALAPAWAEPRVRLAQALAGRGVRDEPLHLWREAVALDPNHVEARVRLGTALVAAGRLDEGEPHLRVACQLDPHDCGAAAGLASLLERRGSSAEAWQVIADLPAEDTRLALAAASIGRYTGHAAAALARVDAALARIQAALTGATLHDRTLLLHARGDLLDALDRPDEAFAAWMAANTGRGLRFDATQHHRAVDHLIRRTTGRVWPTPDPAAERVVLIVGMPRTGSTLLEQALSRHPAIAAAGELEVLRDTAIAARQGAEKDWADGLERITTTGAAPLRARYLAALGAVHPTAPRVTDKMPNNLLHLGFLAAILPGARVIRCHRDPLDTAFSCFRQAFGAGLPWAASLPGIAAWMAAAERLLDHWQATLPLRFLDIHYESLVHRPDVVLPEVCTFLGVPFDAALLTPEHAARTAATASALEVRSAIHTRSVGRARRYAGLMIAHGWGAATG